MADAMSWQLKCSFPDVSGWARQMHDGKFIRRKAFLLAFSAMALIASDQAHAANTLLELFQQRRQKQAEVAPTPAPAPVKKPATSPERAKPVAATTAPANPDALARRAKVQASQVYDYKPEKLVRIDFNAVDPQRPSATDALTEGMSAIGVDEPAIGAGQKSFNEAEDYLKETQVYAEKAIADAIVSYYTNKRHFIWVADDQALDKA